VVYSWGQVFFTSMLNTAALVIEVYITLHITVWIHFVPGRFVPQTSSQIVQKMLFNYLLKAGLMKEFLAK